MDFDLTWLLWFLVAVVALAIAYWIVRTLIMPVVPPGAQPAVWAIIGLVLLFILIAFVTGHFGGFHHSVTAH